MEAEHSLRETLRTYWGFDCLLPLQAEAMACVMQGRDSLVVLPTGGGKSLCFQAPAMCLDGLALVVSPLIALMKDQVDALRNCGVPAAFANSTLSASQRRRLADDIRARRLRLLYLAPERLLADGTLEFLATIRVSLVAIDEAHCISSWGHDFRPEYRGLGSLKEVFPHVGIHAYTATASETVRQDIAQQLQLDNAEILVGSFDRPNLVYKVQRRSDRLKQICEVVQRHPREAGIVYCITRKDVDQTTSALTQLGYRAAAYHAGMTGDERCRNQERFLKEDADIIVATVAFGMGIDKPNVRYVIHAGMPKSLESYQQESGRAGRDGLEAECCLFYSGQDYAIWKRMIQESEPEAREGALQSLAAMFDFCTGVQCRHRAIVEYFGQRLNKTSCDACDVCLGQLELVDDPLVIGQKILSCVLRLREQFGGDYTAKVLHGSHEQRILERGHHRLTTCGLLAGESVRTIRDWIEQLVSQDFLEKVGEYNVLHATAAGHRLLHGEMTPRLLRPTAPAKAAQPTAAVDAWEGVDRGLFDELRRLRQERAAAQDVPTYVVFDDAALRDMARYRPTGPEAFRQVKGVGELKLAQYGEQFVQRIALYCHANGLPTDVARPATATTQISRAPSGPRACAIDSFRFFRQGLSVQQVAQRMNRATSTVHRYLSEFIQHEKITDPSPWVDADTARRVAAAAQEVGTQLLRPIFERLDGQVSYDAIRIVAACMQHAERGQDAEIS